MWVVLFVDPKTCVPEWCYSYGTCEEEAREAFYRYYGTNQHYLVFIPTPNPA